MNHDGLAAGHHPVILAIESATPCGSIAVVGNTHCLCEQTFYTNLTHSRRLLAIIKRLMEQLEIGWHHLDGIAVSVGPGSFTGLRIGLATAKGLSLATGLPLFGVPTLDGLAIQLWRGRHILCPVIDARKKEVYAAFYQWGTAENLERITGYMAVSPQRLTDMVEGSVVFTGDGAILYEKLFKKALGEKALFAPAAIFFPRAAAVGSIAVEMAAKEGALSSPSSIAPIYVRPPDAEIGGTKEKSKTQTQREDHQRDPV